MLEAAKNMIAIASESDESFLLDLEKRTYFDITCQIEQEYDLILSISSICLLILYCVQRLHVYK